MTHNLTESQWNRGHFRMKKWSLRSTRAGAYQQKGSKATLPLTVLFWVPPESGELVVGQRCNWIVMENWDLCMVCTARWRQHWKSSAPPKRAELTALLCLLKKVIGPIKVHVDSKGMRDGLWRGERKCIEPKAGDAELRIKIWEELHLLVSKEIMVEVEHVKAHRTKKNKTKMSQFEKFVTEGNEKADELAKAGSIHGGDESKDSPAGARRGARSLAVRRKLSLFGTRMERL